MALAIDSQETSSTAHRATSSPLTWSFTNTAGNLLVVGVVATGTGTSAITGVTYNGVSMTGGPTISWETNASVVQLFYLATPATGAHTVSVSGTGTSLALLAGAISFSGADTSTPFGSSATAKNDTTFTNHAQAGNITGASGNYVFGVGGYGSGQAATADQTESFHLVGTNNTGGDNILGGYALSSGSAINFGFTWSSSDFMGVAAVEVKAASGGSNGSVTAVPDAITVALPAPVVAAKYERVTNVTIYGT